MEHPTQTQVANDHAFPMIFIVLPAFVGAILWLIAMLSRFAQ
jgi:hypothetical protein